MRGSGAIGGRTRIAAETTGAILIDRLSDGGRVLLGLRAAHKSFAGCWDVIGGHVEPGETPWTALCRELTEELGISCQDGTHLATFTLHDPDGRPSLLHLHAVCSWEGEPAVRNDEHVALRWFSLDEAEQLPNLASPRYAALFAALRDSSA